MSRFNIRVSGFLFIATFVIFFALMFKTPIPTAPCKRCNIIIISIDSLRADHMGLYGYEKNTTPLIDTWAKDAFVFDNYYVNAYLTPISAAGLHTGLDTGNHGVINFQAYLRDGVKMIAERLVDEGYLTAAIGNSSEFEIWPAMENNFHRGFSVYEPGGTRAEIPWTNIKGFITEKSDPFFLWIPIGKVHWPYGLGSTPKFTDPEYRGVLKNKILNASVFNHLYNGLLHVPLPQKFTGFFGFIDDRNFSNTTYYQYPEEIRGRSVEIFSDDVQYIRNQYDNGVAQTDREIGEFLNWLKQNGYDKNTVVIIESEHGEDLGEHRYVAHYDIFDTNIRVPLIIKVPNTTGGRLGQLMSNVDVLPTINDILGLGFKLRNINGKTAISLLRGSSEEIRDEVFITRTPLWERFVFVQDTDSIFSEFRRKDDESHFRDTAIRNKEWKLIHRRAREIENYYSLWRFIGGTPPTRAEYELYNLFQDPLEQDNVAEQFPGIVIKLKYRLLQWEEASWNEKLIPSTTRDLQEYF
ncbi:MAG: sulfatase [Patescibacteria group bacterium]